MKRPIVWVDIPTLDVDRAIKFYSTILGEPVARHDMGGGFVLGVFPHEQGEISGCLFKKDGEQPSASGPLLYFNVEGRLSEAEELASSHGGRILISKHAIGPYGFRSVILDSEGNRIALHSQSES